MGSILGSNIIVYPLIAIIAFFISYLLSDRIIGWFQEKSLGSREHVLQKLELMFVDTSVRRVTITMLLMSFGLGFLFFFLLLPNLWAGVIIGGIVTFLGWQAPKLIVDYLFDKRCSVFANQMVDALTIMANGISSGLSVPQSMERVVDNMPHPVSQEFQLVLSQIRLGLSLEEALTNLGERIPVADVQMFVTAINILKETGGNMAETFATIVETIRERQKVQKKIEALTAQGMMQGIIITLVPFFLLIIFFLLDPGYIKPMFTSTMGVIFLFIMLILQIIGGLSIRKIVKIKV